MLREAKQLKKTIGNDPKPASCDWNRLVNLAKNIQGRIGEFKPKNPGFHRYSKNDFVSQAYLDYVPWQFEPEKFVAIKTSPDGIECL